MPRRTSSIVAQLAQTWADLPLRRKGLAVLALPLAALFLGGLLLLLQDRRQQAADVEVRRSLDVTAEFQQLLIDLLYAETAVRGYLLTGDPAFLVPYDRAVADVSATLETLDRLIRDEGVQQALGTELRPLIAERLAFLAQLRAAAGEADAFPAPIPLNQFLASKAAMDAVLMVLAELTAEEERLLAERRAAADRARTLTLAAIAATVLLGAVGGLVGTGLFTAGVVRRVKHLAENASHLAQGQPIARLPPATDEIGALGDSLAEAGALLREREQALGHWADIFAHAEWGVVVGSADGKRIELLNPAYAAMHGYEVDELVGQPIADVFAPEARDALPEQFRIVHERGHHAFESVHLHRDGHTFPVLVDVTAVRDDAGQVRYRVANVQDITERKRTERELRAANRELEAFSYSVSHDLRAPLRAIGGFSRLLLEDYAEALPEDGRRYLKIVHDGTVQMGRLIDDLLAFSRLGRQPLRTRAVHPASIVEEVLVDLRGESEGRAVELVVDDLPVCQADPVLFKQVYANLLSNALKYTRGRNPARIEVGAEASGAPREHAYFVRDNGVGFDMAYAHKLFGVFQRLHRAEDYEGTGVGLALVQRIVHRHGGRVWAEAAVDHGATFWFTLPAEPSRDPAAERPKKAPV